ncbi:MAG: ParB/RepB/Spo0J family partition protein [Candidatus Heteroscillospira sp.]
MNASNTAVRRELLYLPADEILPNPVQPRRCFEEEPLRELADSISVHGILQPLTVRSRRGRYELIAGERRLRAAKLAGLKSVPCLVVDVSTEESSLLALVENLQRRDLDFIEEAEGIARLTRIFGLSREETAQKLGKSPSAIANKLRILKLPPEVLEGLRRENLSERHGRAMLRLPDRESQLAAFEQIVRRRLTVAGTEAMIDRMLEERQRSARRAKFILKDVRVFLNSLNRALELMQRGGIEAKVDREDREQELLLTIRIPRSRTE